jgi:hypothetical protein
MKQPKNENKKVFLHEGHGKPVTRRQFLAAGLLNMSALCVLPTIADLILRQNAAYAAGCDNSGGAKAGMLPFLVFDCAGGAALAGNWVVGKKGGSLDFLASYDQMGVPTNPAAGEPIDQQFGLPMYSNLSQIRTGILQTSTPAALVNVRMGSICAASQDDTGNNALSPLVMVSKSGLAGINFSNGLGTRNSAQGANSQGPISDATLKPLQIQSVDDVVNALSYGPGLASLNPDQIGAMARAIKNMSSSQLQKLAGMDLGAQFAAIAECAYTKNLDFIRPPANVDPRLDANCQAVYGITPTSTGGATQSPSVVFNVLNGSSGPGAITIGGCDYHDGTQTSGDAKDLQIGQEIGRAIELARRLNKKFVFAVISDGGIYADQGTRNWRGDSGQRGMAVIGVYDPNTPASQIRTQVGNFTDGQGADRSTYVGSDPKRIAYSLFANYLSVCNNIGSFAQIVPATDFDIAQIDQHLIFG